MTLTFCRIFNMIVKHKSFIKAAEALNMTPSAVSHAVSDAESSIGFMLFNRTKSGVTLTENGRTLYPSVMQLLGSEDSLNQSIDKLNGLCNGNVNLGIFNSVCTNWMPEIFKRFSSQYPDIDIGIYEGSYDDVIYWIKNGFVDFGLLSTSCTDELYVEGIYRDELVCIVPPDFPNKKKGCITIEEMSNQHFIIQSKGSDSDVQTLFRKYGLKFHTSCHVLDDTSVMAMISCSRGISVMPLLTAKGLEGNLKVLKLSPEEYRVIGLSALNIKALSPASKALYKCIKEYMTEQAHNQGKSVSEINS